MDVLQVHHGFHEVENLAGRFDFTDDGLRVLVGHRRLVKRALADTRAVNAVHRLAERLHREQFLRLVARQQPSRAVRCRTVPVGVGLALADGQSVAHIERNHHPLAFVTPDGTLADNHIAKVQVVVDGRDGLHHPTLAELFVDVGNLA